MAGQSPSSVHPADAHDVISVRGAQENNLKNLSIDLPKRRLTVFTGLSGSGKSSLVFNTIAAESQRLINETYSAFVQGFMPSLARPEVESLGGITTAIVVDQERLGANPRSTVGTATDAYTLLRILFSQLSEPQIGPPNAFSFNVPAVKASGMMKKGDGKAVKKTYSVAGGMCLRCEGTGQVNDIDLDQIFDRNKSLAEGAITVPNYSPDGWYVKLFIASGFLDPNKPIKDYSETELHDFLHKEPVKVKFDGANMTYEGLIPKIKKSFLSKDPSAMQPHIRAFVERAVTFISCPECAGSRLNEVARSAQLHGLNIAQAADMQITGLAAWLTGITNPAVAPLLTELQRMLDSFVDIGLGYLALNRPAGTLSGGEAQRTKMIRHLGSSLTDVTYVFDEPTAGLHPHDITKMNQLLLQLRDKGNTVLVVEHKPAVIEIADHIVDLGPGAGSAGGQVTYQGDLAGLLASDTLTGKHLKDRTAAKSEVRGAVGQIEVRGAHLNNLQNVDVDIPLGVLCVVSGVAGSGKSSLVHGSLPTSAQVVRLDQSPIRGSRRSNPATYTGLLDQIRTAFAKHNGVKPALFSANSAGACPGCNGIGLVFTDLGFMNTVSTVCEECQGRRFQAAVLEYELGGRNIAEVLEMSAQVAAEFFATGPARTPAAGVITQRLVDVGLGYLNLGQPLNTLSGGERQRLKLATHLGEKGGIYVLDEPTTGLHLADVTGLLGLLDQLVDSGKSVIVVEHHPAVIAHADWVLDLGPGAGHDGGQVVFTGTPAELTRADTLTGQHLAAYLAGEQ